LRPENINNEVNFKEPDDLDVTAIKESNDRF